MIKKFFLVLLALIILSILFLVLRPDQTISKEAAQEKYIKASSHFVTWRNTSIHYTDEGSGMPLIFIHGYGGSHRNFEAITQILKNNFRIIRIDLPGFGLSDMPQVKTDESVIGVYRDYLGFILDSLSLDSVYVAGNSLGGWMALEAAVLRPEKVKKLILMCSAGYEIEKVQEQAAAIMQSKFVKLLFLKGMPEYFTNQGATKCFYDKEKINPEEVKINNELWNRAGNLSAAMLLVSSGEKPDTTLIPKVACPTLIISGKEDRIVPFEHGKRFQRDIANSKLLIYDACGHIPMVEKPQQTADDILQFLNEQKTNIVAI